MAAAMGRAGGSSRVSRGTEVGSSLRPLADQGRKDADTGNSCFPDSEEG